MADAGPPNRNRMPASIGVEAARRRLESSDPPFLLDVREPWEFVQAHVPSARLIPLGELERRVKEVPGDRPVLVICQSGQRSLAAASYLAGTGLPDVTNVDGGTGAWVLKGYPVERGPS
jgi:rhodanese-related sulfurtransferase